MTIIDPKEARGWVKAAGERSPVLAEVELHVFRGAVLTVLHDEEQPLSFNVTHFGKRRKNVWEPYANWYIAYTVEWARRRGHARTLAEIAKAEAVARGCRRLKALAGTRLGVLLHDALGDQFWGVTDRAEVVVDTPLVQLPAYHRRTPPNAVTDETEPWPLARVWAELGDRPLRYETGGKTNPPALKAGG